MQNPYHQIPDIPKSATATNIIVRLLDGLAFRYKWSLEGIDDGFMNFKPSDDSMDVDKLLTHIYGLAVRTYNCFTPDELSYQIEYNSIESVKNNTIDIIQKTRDYLINASDEELINMNMVHRASNTSHPFWYAINGPIADALTHVGQIASWRRIYGSPIQKANVFFGTPPE